MTIKYSRGFVNIYNANFANVVVCIPLGNSSIREVPIQTQLTYSYLTFSAVISLQYRKGGASAITSEQIFVTVIR
jgi:hypothetical protein